jgi:tocopherol O-methyltransferase
MFELRNTISLAVAEHYEELDPFYRFVWGEHLHHGLWRTGREDSHAAALNLVRHAIRRLNVRRGDEVVDVGCGYGAVCRMLAQDHGASVTGVTITPSQFAHAMKQNAGARNPRFLLGDWMENTFADRSFDGAIAIESTEHMPDLRHCLSEMHRVLRPGGRAVVCAWLARERPAYWQTRLLLKPICATGGIFAMGTAEEYKKHLGHAGFCLLSEEDLSGHVHKTWSGCMGRALRGMLADPQLRTHLLQDFHASLLFGITVFRIWLAYLAGAIRYKVFTLERGK